MIAQRKVALAARPYGHRIIRIPLGGGGMRFDVTLMDGLCVILPLQD